MREILERVADRWTLLVIDALDGKRELPFPRLRDGIGAIHLVALTLSTLFGVGAARGAVTAGRW